MKSFSRQSTFFLFNVLFGVCFYEVFTRCFPVAKKSGEIIGYGAILTPLPIVITTAVSLLLAVSCFLAAHGVSLRFWRASTDFVPKDITRRIGKVRIIYPAKRWRHYAFVTLSAALLLSFVLNFWFPYFWQLVFTYSAILVSVPLFGIATRFFSMSNWHAITITMYFPQVVYQAFAFATVYLFLKTVFIAKPKNNIQPCTGKTS